MTSMTKLSVIIWCVCLIIFGLQKMAWKCKGITEANAGTRHSPYKQFGNAVYWMSFRSCRPRWEITCVVTAPTQKLISQNVFDWFIDLFLWRFGPILNVLKFFLHTHLSKSPQTKLYPRISSTWNFASLITVSFSHCNHRSSPAHQFESCDYRDKFYRHVSKGGWPFSTSAHGWPISDCTGEALKGVLALMDSPLVMKAVEKGVIKGIESFRLYDAVNVILTLQNEDGGK